MNINPIEAHKKNDGRYCANVNGISKGSITCYFDSNGNLVAHTLEKGRLYDQLLIKLLSEIATRGVVLLETKAGYPPAWTRKAKP